jgi:DNA-binding transcriptional regulator GbsR (MarR family)
MLMDSENPPHTHHSNVFNNFRQNCQKSPVKKLLTKTDISVISVLTETKEMNALSPVQQKFILHWGEMGTRWGINRTVAQTHALLFISPKPLNADDLVETLGVARSNISTSLKELQSWGIVKLVHVMGDKRDHFESMKDVWELFRVVLNERKRREIDPTIQMLHECLAEAGKEPVTDAYTQDRLRDLLGFFETTTAWYVQIRQWPTSALTKFVKLGDKALKLLGFGG